MHENPYTQLLDSMRSTGSKDNPLVYITGRVTKLSPVEITAQIDGQQLKLESDDVKIAAYMKNGYSRTATHGDISGDITFTTNELDLDSELLMIPSADRQLFYIICKLEAL